MRTRGKKGGVWSGWLAALTKGGDRGPVRDRGKTEGEQGRQKLRDRTPGIEIKNFAQWGEKKRKNEKVVRNTPTKLPNRKKRGKNHKRKKRANKRKMKSSPRTKPP